MYWNVVLIMEGEFSSREGDQLASPRATELLLNSVPKKVSSCWLVGKWEYTIQGLYRDYIPL